MHTDEIHESVILSHNSGTITFNELVELSGLSTTELKELIDLGIIEPMAKEDEVFNMHSLLVIRTASRLRHDFNLSASGLVLAITYWEHIQKLEARLTELECQLLKSY